MQRKGHAGGWSGAKARRRQAKLVAPSLVLLHAALDPTLGALVAFSLCQVLGLGVRVPPPPKNRTLLATPAA